MLVLEVKMLLLHLRVLQSLRQGNFFKYTACSFNYFLFLTTVLHTSDWIYIISREKSNI
jgi:hypothetical protein